MSRLLEVTVVCRRPEVEQAVKTLPISEIVLDFVAKNYRIVLSVQDEDLFLKVYKQTLRYKKLCCYLLVLLAMLMFILILMLAVICPVFELALSPEQVLAIAVLPHLILIGVVVATYLKYSRCERTLTRLVQVVRLEPPEQP